MMWPFPRARIPGRIAWMTAAVPTTLVSSWSRSASRVISSTVPCTTNPAALTRTSTEPNRCSATATALAMEAGSVTSSGATRMRS